MRKHSPIPDGDVPFTEEQEKTRDAELAQSVKDREEYAKVKYRDDRKKDYPEFGDQLDYIFHNGLEKRNTDIVQPIKDKYPKP